MNNKTIFIIILILLLISTTGLVLIFTSDSLSGHSFFENGLRTANLLTAILLIKNSAFLKSIHFNLILVCVAITTIGALFKIMHWPGNSILLTIGLLGIPVCYGLRFISKPTKSRLDILKLIWVFSTYSIAWLTIMHYIDKTFSFIPSLFMLLSCLDFYLTCRRDPALMLK